MMGEGRFASRVARSLHAGLAAEIEKVYRNRCPCCNKVMRRARKAQLRYRVPRDHPTVAHDEPTGGGGNPEVWVYACQACNHEQGQLTFRQWAGHLAYVGDERAARVEALADRIDAWCEETGTPKVLERKKRRPTPWISAA